MWLFILIIIAIFSYLKFGLKLQIKWKTFLKKGFKVNRGLFGVYCYCGKQGRGKTYSVVEFLKEHKNEEIYCNIKDLKGINYTYFEGFDELLKLRNKKNCIIVYDEIFTALTRTSKMNTDVLDFLSQMRKRQIVFLTTAQEWLEINITLRRYCRYQIECNIINIFGRGLLIKHFYDAEQIKWSNLDNEYIAPLCNLTLSKCNILTANSYDTYQTINSYNVKKE